MVIPNPAKSRPRMVVSSLIGRAAREVGADRAKVRDYIESVGKSGGSPAMAGVAGLIAFDEKHDAVNKPVVVAQVGR